MQDKAPELLETALVGLPPRWKNWVIRGIFTWLMIGGFGLIIYGGPLALMLTTFLVQVKVNTTHLSSTFLNIISWLKSYEFSCTRTVYVRNRGERLAV